MRSVMVPLRTVARRAPVPVVAVLVRRMRCIRSAGARPRRGRPGDRCPGQTIALRRRPMGGIGRRCRPRARAVPRWVVDRPVRLPAWTGRSRPTAARWRDCRRTRSGPTPPTSSGSPSGPSAAVRAGRPTSTGSSCAATWPSWPPAATPRPPSPARRRPCGPTSAGAPGGVSSTADPSVRLSAPSPDSRLPRVLGHAELDRLLGPVRPAGGRPARRPSPDGAASPRDVRDDAVLELLYGSGMRVAELCGLDVDDLDLGPGRGHRDREGVTSSARCWSTTVRGGAAGLAGRSRAGHGRPARHPGCAVLQRAGEPPRIPGRPADPRPPVTGPHPPPRPPPHLRHPPARRGCRPAGRPGIARACQPADHAGLHSCQQGAPAFGVLRNASTGLRGAIGDATRHGWTRHRRPVGRVQEDRRQGAARSADRALRPCRQVRGRPGVGRAAPPRGRGRPGQLRDHRADRRHRAVRAGPQHQVRDLRRPPDQGRHHRRAPLHRLGAPLGAGQGPGRRAVVLQARGHPSTGRRPTPRWPPTSR